MVLKLILVIAFVFINNVYSSVIIIGAGAAGIAAFSKLMENNITDVKILEAEDRIGGRIFSAKFGKNMVDLGAEWCHGSDGNIVYELVNEYGILVDELALPTFVMNHKILDEDLTSVLNTNFENVYYTIGKNAEEGLNLEESFSARYNESIHDIFYNNSESLQIAADAQESFERFIMSHEGSLSMRSVSARNDYEVCEGSQALSWHGRGYKTILDVLLKEYPDRKKALLYKDHILLNKEVSKIIWRNENSPDSSVNIICSDESEYKADTVIFTPSINVLKNNYKTLFEPSLPIKKQRSIDSFGMGAVGKVWLYWENPWWSHGNFSSLFFIWSDADKKEAASEFPESIVEGKNWLFDIFAVVVPGSNPNVMTAWVAGENLPFIETLPEKTVVDGIMYLLNRFVGHKYTITEPELIVWFRWYSNPHFSGSYSYQTMAARKLMSTNDFELSEPLRDSNNRSVVLFAGEATHPIYYSTVHGAIETGFREAIRVINKL